MPDYAEKLELELRRVEARYGIGRIAVHGIMVALWIAATALPLLVLDSVVEPFAGQNTEVDVNVVVSITAALSLAVNALQAMKGDGRKKEIQRLRRRTNNLEAELGLPPTRWDD